MSDSPRVALAGFLFAIACAACSSAFVATPGEPDAGGTVDIPLPYGDAGRDASTSIASDAGHDARELSDATTLTNDAANDEDAAIACVGEDSTGTDSLDCTAYVLGDLGLCDKTPCAPFAVSCAKGSRPPGLGHGSGCFAGKQDFGRDVTCCPKPGCVRMASEDSDCVQNAPSRHVAYSCTRYADGGWGLPYPGNCVQLAAKAGSNSLCCLQ